ncbi:Uncharacterized protein FWK35_00006415 [Aphis craccivora]|uniref:Uncharacterized protein n=1 Tax=Aphis craccivora TaxID=307492 RepID=A0A6G0ZN40_APHCR|nr:Uncharacterized protein FWK35_00006415 [Aphis craccivora]
MTRAGNFIIISRNNAPISNFGGGFRCKSEYPLCMIEVKMSIKKFWMTKIHIFTKSVENANIFNISRTIFFLLAFEVQNLNFGVFRPLKHKPPFSPTTGNYILG